MTQAKPEKKIKECTVGKIIQRWVRGKRKECLADIVDQNEELFRKKVREALDKLYRAHKIGQLISGIQDIKYEDPFFQFGYTYKHSMFSARSLSTVMACSNALGNLGKKTSITVACLGGGPGSDVLGVLDYFLKYMGDFEGQLDIQLYDRMDKWGTCWESLGTAIKAKWQGPLRMQVEVNFHDFDVTKADKSKPDVRDADVITMHYFMEEVYSESEEEEVKECFDHIIQTAKQGALFLYSGMYMFQVINWVHHLLKDKCKLLTPDTKQPRRRQMKYLDFTSTKWKWVPCSKVNLKNEKDLKLFDDIRAYLEIRYNTEKVSQRYKGKVVYRLYQKQ